MDSLQKTNLLSVITANLSKITKNFVENPHVVIMSGLERLTSEQIEVVAEYCIASALKGYPCSKSIKLPTSKKSFADVIPKIQGEWRDPDQAKPYVISTAKLNDYIQALMLDEQVIEAKKLIN